MGEEVDYQGEEVANQKWSVKMKVVLGILEVFEVGVFCFFMWTLDRREKEDPCKGENHAEMLNRSSTGRRNVGLVQIAGFVIAAASVSATFCHLVAAGQVWIKDVPETLKIN